MGCFCVVLQIDTGVYWIFVSAVEKYSQKLGNA